MEHVSELNLIYVCMKLNIAACCVRRLLLQYSAAQAMLATPGVPCVTSPRSMLLLTAGFSVHEIFPAMGLDTLVNAGFF